jgi:hypothetical protein
MSSKDKLKKKDSIKDTAPSLPGGPWIGSESRLHLRGRATKRATSMAESAKSLLNLFSKAKKQTATDETQKSTAASSLPAAAWPWKKKENDEKVKVGAAVHGWRDENDKNRPTGVCSGHQ